MALFAVPVFVYALFSFVGWCVMKALKGRRNWGRLIGLVMGLLSVGVFLYGFTYGFRELEVKRVTIAVPQLPASFDGYRIVLFSDFHAGSYYGWRSDLPQRDVDSINAQHPDMICFTGDIQNTRPSELKPYVRMLSSLRAGRCIQCAGQSRLQLLCGCRLAHLSQAGAGDSPAGMADGMASASQRACRGASRGSDSIYVAGTENFKKPAHANVAKALRGIRPGHFVLMLQHIPTQWEDMVPSRINQVYGGRGEVLVAPQLL